MMSIKGFKSQQALSKKLGGYTEDQSIDQARYVTVQEMSGKRHALDVVIQGAYQIGALPLTAASGSNIRVIKCVAHGASKNDIIRLSNGTQFSAISIPDADTIITSVELDVDPTGDTFTIWRHITPSYNADGSLNVLASQAPIKFNKDGVATTVNYDTFAPSSSEALPVNIVTVNGQGIATTVDLSGAQINVQLTDRGSSPDSVQIGDGTTIVGVYPLTNDLKTHDSLSKVILDDIQQNTVDTYDSVNNIDLKTPALGQALEASSIPVVLTAAQVITLTPPAAITGFATETTLGDIKTNTDNIPALGQALEANSVPVVLTAAQLITLTPPSAITGFSTSANQTNGTQQTKIGNGTITAGVNSLATQLVSTDNGLIVNAVMHGITTGGGGGYVDVKVNPSGALTVESTVVSSALPTGAATSASQALQLAQETNINTALGLTADAVATTDTGTFSLIALTKRIAQNITTMSAKLPAALGVQGSGASLSVVQASSSSFSVVDVVRVPTYAESLVITQASAITLSAPATARTMKVQADNTNTVTLRYKVAATPTASSGHQLEPGRSEDWTVAGDVVVIAESTASAQKIYVTWGA